jgi:hypothetical protein
MQRARCVEALIGMPTQKTPNNRQLHATTDLTDEAWEDLRQHVTEMAVVEISMLARSYRTLSYLTSSLRLPLETFAKRFPL